MRRRQRSRSAAQHAVEVEGKVHEQTQDAGESRAGERIATAEALYSRPMPGGGYVRVEVVREPSAEHLRGRVVIERRTPTPATPEEEPLVVEEVEGGDPNVVVDQLFRIACDNVAIARRVLQRLKQSVRAD
jgi:hypothetical protein